NKDGYVLIIRNYKDFLKQDPKKKEIVIDEFKNNILPFWEEEVTRTVVGGKAKPFNVYIVE
ncbi:MAG: hypothetical protein LBI13_02915, partial [Streptococcaceae bacterium]|nr:hypothetical protein [Streptococcaceae bacterium]